MIVPLWIKKQSHQNIIAVFHYVIKEVRFVRAARKLFLSSLSQGIFTEWSIFSVSFLLWKKRSFGPVTQWRQLVSCDWLWHSHGSLIQSRFDLKINRRDRNIVELHALFLIHRMHKLSPCASDVSACEDQQLHAIRRQCSKLAIVRSSETTKKFIGQPIFSKIKRLVVQGKNNGQPSQK